MRARPSWLNRNVAGMSITSFCADVGYEMVLAVLPGFAAAIGLAAAALGWIEAAAGALVGMLWMHISPQAAFTAAGVLMVCGAIMLLAGRP
jgi:hypothetical protein